MAMNCPNISHPDYIALRDKYNDTVAHVLFQRNGDKIPSLEQAESLLYQGVNNVLPFEEVRSRVLKGFSKYGQLVNKRIGNVTLQDEYTTATGKMSKEIAVQMQKWMDGIPEFRSAKVEYSPVYGALRIVPAKISGDHMFQMSSSFPVDEGLNAELSKFVRSMGGEIRNVSEIVIDGKRYNAAAVTDILNKTISIVEGRAGMDTLPEEAAHLFVEYLPEGSNLLKQMMRDITSRPIYDEVMNEYRDNKLYQNEDGSVNNDKIAREAIGKMIAKAITDKWASREEKSVWQKLWAKLWNFIKDIINRFRNEPETEVLPYDEIASDIMAGNIDKIDLEKIRQADEQGMYYLQQTKEEKEYDEHVLNSPEYTDEQKASYRKVHFENHQRLQLDEENHEYRTLHKNPNDQVKYTSNTMAINGKKELSTKAKQQGEWSAQWGKEADNILRAIAMGHDWDHIKNNIDTPSFNEDVKQGIHNILLNAYNNYVSTYPDGSKDLAAVQSILTYEPDNAQKYLAASSDLIVFAPDGSIKYILDLKTSLKSLRSAQVAYSRGKGSWLPADTMMTKREEYALQLTNEYAMIQIAHPDILIQPNVDGHQTMGTHSLVWHTDPKDPSKLIGVTDDGFTPANFDLTRWTLISGGAFVPPGPRLRIFDEPTAEQMEDAFNDMSQEEQEEFINAQQKRNETIDGIMDKLNNLFMTRSKSILPEFGNSIANNFRKIAADIQELRNQGERNKAMLAYFNAIQRFTNLYSSYIKDPENFKEHSYYQILQETIKMAEAHLEYLPEEMRELLNPEQLAQYDALRKSIHELKADYTLFARKYVTDHVAQRFTITDIKDKNGNVIKTKEQQIQDILWSPENDLTMTSLMGDAIREMSVPLLGQLSLIVDKAHLEHTINANKIADEIATAGVEFEKATGLKLQEKSSTDYMFELNEDGSRKRWLDVVGDSYYQEKHRVDALMLDLLTGERMKFIPDAQEDVVVPWHEMVDGKVVTEQIPQTEYNIRLDERRKERRAFYDPESIDYGYEEEPGNYSPLQHMEGVYHSLSPSYIAERNRVMRFSILSRDGANSRNYGEWVGKKGISKKQSDIDDFNKWAAKPVNRDAIEGKTETDKWNAYWKAQVDKFRSDYQTFAQYWQMEKKYDKENKAWVPTGRMIRKSGFFPNERHIVINENKMEFTGTHMEPKESLQNKKYVDMKNDTSDIGKAKFAFYNAITGYLAQAVKKGGDQCERWYREGGLINLSHKFFKKAAEGGVLNQVGHFAESSFTAIPNATSKSTDDFGIPRQELLVPFMSNVRNMQRIKDIKDALTSLESNQKDPAKKISGSEYIAEKERLESQLKYENHKNDVNDLEVNPVRLVSAFSAGAEKYAQMASIEGQVLAIRDIFRQEITDEQGRPKQFWQLNNIGQRITRVGTGGQKEFVFRRKDDTNALKKAEDYVKLFYGDIYSKKTMDVIVDRLMNITLFGALGFNYMGHFKNAVLNQASNFRQNIAERFVTRRNYNAAQKEFFGSFLPGMQTKIFDKKSGPFKATSKMEWIMHHFGLDINIQHKAMGKTEGQRFLDFAYMGDNFANKWAQYTIQGAFMRDNILKDKDGNELRDGNGNPVSLYDAFQWDPNTGKCTLRPEAQGTEDEQKMLILKVKDIQTKTQGNYEESNRPMIKNYLLGRILSQFHNYVKTSWNDRFQLKYTHATLGEMEGTWTSVVSYYKLLKEFEGYWFKNLKKGWNNLSEMQQKNLKTDLAETLMIGSFILVGALIQGIAAGLSNGDGPNDDPRKKKLLNLIAYTMDATGKEQGMFHPIGGIFNLKEFIENPIALKPVVTGIIDALVSSIAFPFQDDEHRYYQRGVFRGNAKAAENWRKIIPLLKQMHRWQNFSQQAEFNPVFAKY